MYVEQMDREVGSTLDRLVDIYCLDTGARQSRHTCGGINVAMES